MPGSLAIVRVEHSAASTRELSLRSRAWADVDARSGADAVLVVAEPIDDGIVLGAFQRAGDAGEVPSGATMSGASTLLVRRGSGGAAARVSPGTIWMQLALSRVDALVPCTPDKLLNRYVRPLLRALTRTSSAPVSYFGRDWLSAKHRPVALVAFAHEARSGRALVEAIIGVKRSAFDGGRGERASFRGKLPATLEEIAGRAIDAMDVADAIASAYRSLAGQVVEAPSVAPPDEVEARSAASPPYDDQAARSAAAPLDDDQAARSAASPPDDDALDDTPWTALREEAIGVIGAGRDASGRMRIGGELMASRDAIARLEELVAGLPPDASADDVGRVVDDALTTRGAVTFGVRSLASIRDAIVDAIRTSPEERSSKR